MYRLVIALFLLNACHETGAGSIAPNRDEGLGLDPRAATEGLHAECESFEILDFGDFSARTLAGFVRVDASSPRGLGGVTISAARVDERELHRTVSSADGRYSLDISSAGEYEVSVCLAGYDEIRFTLTIDPGCEVNGLHLYLGPSEAPGRREVVPVLSMREGRETLKRLLVPALVCLACQPSIFPECSNSVRAESASPDGRYVAAFYERDCGATTDYATADTITLVTLSRDSEALEGVEVTAVYADGEQRALGRTNGLGLLRVPGREVREDLSLLLFCRKGFFCGALRTTDPSFFDYQEHLIALAPWMVT